jgi:hypothetical protein
LASEVGPTRSTTSDEQGAPNIQTLELTARQHFSELKKTCFLDTKSAKIRPSNEAFFKFKLSLCVINKHVDIQCIYTVMEVRPAVNWLTTGHSDRLL